jgi:hypothetical protein
MAMSVAKSIWIPPQLMMAAATPMMTAERAGMT